MQIARKEKMDIIFLQGIKERLSEFLSKPEKEALTNAIQNIDKLSHRNMQIKDLKKHIKKVEKWMTEQGGNKEGILYYHKNNNR